MFCPNCGKPFADNSKFCGHCGEPNPAVSSMPAPAMPLSPQADKKPATLIIVLCAVGAVLLLAILVFLGLLIFKGFEIQPAEDEFSYSLEDAAPSAEAPTEAPTDAYEIWDTDYMAYFDENVPHIIAGSDQRYLCREDIISFSQEQLLLAGAEIQARHGATFQDPSLQAYFDAQSWYAPGRGGELNHMEQTNLELLEANQLLVSNKLYSSNNPYIPYLRGTNTFMIADSNTRYLVAEDLEHATDEELMLIRNEIYARHGYIFKSEDLREFFYCKDWYQPAVLNEEFDDSYFSKIELANVKLVRVYEKLMDGVKFSGTNPYARYYNASYEWFFYDSSTRKLDDGDLYHLNLEQLTLARNEIYARNGYSYSDEDLFAYFAQCSWYRPNVAPGRKSEVVLNSIEKANVKLIEKYEDALEDLPENLHKLDGHYTHDVETKRFSVIVPRYWKDYCTVKKTSKNGAHYVAFYESISYDFNGTGRLFTICLLPPGSDYYSYPAYKYLGTLTDYDGVVYDVVVTYPTDVQPIYAAEELYMLMWVDVDDILYTFQPGDGCAFSS